MKPAIQRCPVVVHDLRQVLGCKYEANSEFPSAKLSKVSLPSSAPLGLAIVAFGGVLPSLGNSGDECVCVGNWSSRVHASRIRQYMNARAASDELKYAPSSPSSVLSGIEPRTRHESGRRNLGHC
jgi:hypothetical protein